MNIHRNAKLTLIRREELVGRVAAGETPRAVATALGVSERTIFKWLMRYRQNEGLADRSSRPHCSPNALTAEMRLRIGELRRLRWTGRRIAAHLKLASSTVFRILRSIGLNRLKKLEPEPPKRRYQWDHPGDMLHIDIKKLGRIKRPGHRAHGDRSCRSRGAGWEYVHVCVDDASRVAFAQIMSNERQESVVEFLKATVKYYRGLGVTLRRVMTDNGSGYVSKAFRAACASLGLRHIRTRPYTPRTNGKAERFIQTAMREWAYAVAYEHSEQRASELPRWLFEYNYLRNHVALQGDTPISRIGPKLNNLCRHHS